MKHSSEHTGRHAYLLSALSLRQLLGMRREFICRLTLICVVKEIVDYADSFKKKDITPSDCIEFYVDIYYV